MKPAEADYTEQGLSDCSERIRIKILSESKLSAKRLHRLRLLIEQVLTRSRVQGWSYHHHNHRHHHHLAIHGVVFDSYHPMVSTERVRGWISAWTEIQIDEWTDRQVDEWKSGCRSTLYHP
jgi:hypothetical protein